jgi:hypothetical protein
MMGRRERGRGQFFYAFDLDKVVPADHLVRQIDGVLDLDWVHKELAPYYSHTGRPSIDPVLMIRMLLVGYVFAIRSERQLCSEVQVAAIVPDGELHEPGKVGRKAAVEATSIDLPGNTANDSGAAAWPVTARAVRVVSLEPAQDPGPVQKVVDQGIDGDQLHTDLFPFRPNISSADQNAGQRHRQHLVGNAVNIAQRFPR